MEFRPEHIGLPARNPEALMQWYLHTLGAALVFQNPPAYYMKLPGGLIIEIYPAQAERPEVENNGLAGWRHLALKVPSIESARRLLEDRGVSFSDQLRPAGGGGQVLFFKDPEGNLLHLVERPADSPLA